MNVVKVLPAVLKVIKSISPIKVIISTRNPSTANITPAPKAIENTGMDFNSYNDLLILTNFNLNLLIFDPI